MEAEGKEDGLPSDDTHGGAPRGDVGHGACRARAQHLLEEITQEQQEEAVGEERAEELAAACRALERQVACGGALVLFLVLLAEHTTEVVVAPLRSHRRAWPAQLRSPQLVFAHAKGCCGSSVALGLEEGRQFAVVWPVGEALPCAAA